MILSPHDLLLSFHTRIQQRLQFSMYRYSLFYPAPPARPAAASFASSSTHSFLGLSLDDSDWCEQQRQQQRDTDGEEASSGDSGDSGDSGQEEAMMRQRVRGRGVAPRAAAAVAMQQQPLDPVRCYGLIGVGGYAWGGVN